MSYAESSNAECPRVGIIALVCVTFAALIAAAVLCSRKQVDTTGTMGQSLLGSNEDPHISDRDPATQEGTSTTRSHDDLTVPSATASAPAKETENLTTALKEAKLNQYEAALRELGCAFASKEEFLQDLGDLEESDLIEIGMKKIEIKRLQRLA